MVALRYSGIDKIFKDKSAEGYRKLVFKYLLETLLLAFV